MIYRQITLALAGLGWALFSTIALAEKPAIHAAHSQYQKPGASVRIVAPETRSIQAGTDHTLSYELLSPIEGGIMAVKLVIDERLQSQTKSEHVMTIDKSGNTLDIDILALEDGIYTIDIFVELNGLMRTMAHRFVVGDASQIQQKRSVVKGVISLPAEETIR